MRDARLLLRSEEGMLPRILDVGGGERGATPQGQGGRWATSPWSLETSL